MTEPKRYRYKLPTPHSHWETRSFGIEPCKPGPGGRMVKAGKLIIRLVIHCHVEDARSNAAAAAERITELLNAGREYMGPKIMHFDHNRKHAGIDSYFLPAASEEP